MSNSNYDVAHQFANSTTPIDGGNVSSDGKNYYSYATVVARKGTFEGKEVMFMTSTTYSNTTTRHMSNLYSAARHWDCIELPDARAGQLATNVAELYLQAKNALRDATRRRSAELKESDINTAAARADLALRLMADQNERTYTTLCQFSAGIDLGPRQLKKFLQNTRDKVGIDLDAIKAAADKKRKAAAKKIAKENARILAERAERMERWLAGESVRGMLHDKPNGSRYLRVRDGVVETSGHIAIELTMARAAFCSWRSGKLQAGENMRDVNGHTYRISRVTPDRLTVGCHTIDRTDADAVALAQGWVCKETPGATPGHTTQISWGS